MLKYKKLTHLVDFPKLVEHKMHPLHEAISPKAESVEEDVISTPPLAYTEKQYSALQNSKRTNRTARIPAKALTVIKMQPQPHSSYSRLPLPSGSPAMAAGPSPANQANNTAQTKPRKMTDSVSSAR